MTTLTQSFSALADETRFAIVEKLMAQGELPAGALVAGSGMTAPAISRHLKILRRAGLVNQRIDGTRRLYSANGAGLRMIADWAISRREFWETSLDRLDAAIREDTGNPKGWPG